MRILFMADVPENPDSGAAGTEYQTIMALRLLGHEVDTVWSHDLPQKIFHWNLHSLVELPFIYRKVMLRKMQERNYDVIHVNTSDGYLAAKTHMNMQCKSVFIHRSHGFEPRVKSDIAYWEALYHADRRPYWRRGAGKILNELLSYNSGQIARYADGHIVSVSWCREFLQKVMSVSPECVAVIPQAPPDIFLNKPTHTMTEERLRSILYVGQYAFVKAPMVVAQGMNNIAEADAHVNFTWVCSKAHHPLVEKLLSPAVRKRMALLDWMPQHELIEIYDSHGIFLFPSFFEGFGKVFLEAMARGLCVIASENSGAYDVIHNGQDGIWAPTGSVDEIVRACQMILQDTDKGTHISGEAVRTARSYTWERVARETAAFYQQRLDAKALELSRH